MLAGDNGLGIVVTMVDVATGAVLRAATAAASPSPAGVILNYTVASMGFFAAVDKTGALQQVKERKWRVGEKVRERERAAASDRKQLLCRANCFIA